MIRPAVPSKNLSRKPTTLNTNLNKALISYVAAACAAGGAILAEAMPAEAEIVYTPTNTPIVKGSPVSLDLNHDGVIDFVLSMYDNGNAVARRPSCSVCTFGAHGSLKVSPEQAGNAIWGVSSSVYQLESNAQRRKLQQKKPNTVKEAAAPVAWGEVVGNGPERSFQSQALPMDSSNSFYYFGGGGTVNSLGAWGKGRRFTGPYLGFKFLIDGEIHYGWARVNVHANFLDLSATLTGYAYESVANRPILTGFTHGSVEASSEASQQAQPPVAGSLGRLASGASAAGQSPAAQPAH
ncbi:MAG: hypothetical protein ABR874_22945 [Candidatus Sulfotelmatobacter sp.]|jgi:hypothetical protein